MGVGSGRSLFLRAPYRADPQPPAPALCVAHPPPFGPTARAAPVATHPSPHLAPHRLSAQRPGAAALRRPGGPAAELGADAVRGIRHGRTPERESGAPSGIGGVGGASASASEMFAGKSMLRVPSRFGTCGDGVLGGPDQTWPNLVMFFQFWSKFANIWPTSAKFGRIGAKLARVWPNPTTVCQIRSNSAQFWPTSAQLGPTSAKFWADLGRTSPPGQLPDNCWAIVRQPLGNCGRRGDRRG